MRIAHLALLVLLFSVAGSLRAQLPPQAQEALDKGIIAAKVPDYLLAIRYFEEARKLAPDDSPIILLNMGIAESRLHGRELRAMAWFGAYLASAPAAANAGAVRDEIKVLSIRAQSNVSKLIAALETVADNLPEGFNPMVGHGRNKDFVLGELPGLWAAHGDFERAQNRAARLKIDSVRDDAIKALTLAQARKGEQTAALQSAGRIQSQSEKSATLGEIAEISNAKSRDSAADKVRVSHFLDLLKPIPYMSGERYQQLNATIFRDVGGFLKNLPPPSKDGFDHYHSLAAGVGAMVNYQGQIAALLSRLPK